MSAGGLAGNTVAFGLKAVADLRGVDQTAKALTGLSAKGGQVGTGISRGIDVASRSFDEARQKSESLHASLTKISNVGLLVGGGIVAGLASSVHAFANFEHQMNAVRSVTGATGNEFKQLNALAIKIGADTVFSASEAASALEELAKAGVSTKDILAGAALGATALAAAAGVGIPEAAALIANALNQFGLAGDQATHVADVFANVSNKSAADATDFGDALSYVGTQAHALGVPIEDTAAAIAVLADQGLKGSHAGTSLGQAMTSLVAPTDGARAAQEQLGIVVKNSKGNFVGLPSIIEQVAKATANMGEVQRAAALNALFGIEGARAINALLNTQTDAAKTAGKTWDDYAGAVRVAGTAAEQAAIRNEGLFGAFGKLGGSIEGINLALGAKLAPAIEAVAKGITKATDAFSGLPSAAQTLVAFGLAGVAALALLAAAGARLITIGSSIAATWSQAGVSFGRAGVAASGAAASISGTAAAAEAAALGAADLAAATTAAAAGVTEEGAAAALSVVPVTEFAAAEGAAAASAGALSIAGARAATVLGGIGGTLGLLLPRLAQVAGAIVLIDSATKALQGPQAGPDIADSLAHTVEHGIGTALNQLPGSIGDWLQNDANETLNDQQLFKTVGDLGLKIHQTFVAGLLTQTSGSTIEGLGGLTVKNIQDAAAKSGRSFTDELVSQARALGVSTPQIDAYAAAQTAATAATDQQTAATLDQTDTLAAQVDEQIASKRAQDALNQAVKDTLNTEFLAAAAADGLLLPFTRDAEDAQKATEEFNRSIDGIEASAINAANGIDDISSALPGVQAGFGKVGSSLVDVFRRMDDVGAIDLTPATREALDMASELTRVEGKIADVSAAISNNQSDMSMWEGRIGLVTDAFGADASQIGDWITQLETGQITQEQFNAAIDGLGGNGGFPRLDALLAQGKISQEQYQAAVKAGTHLLERSAGALQDEDAELVANIIALDGYVTAHDDADGAVQHLTNSQRGFLAAMADSKTQTFLQTLQLLEYLAASGQIPQERVTKFIVDSSAASPVIHGIVQDLGLLPGERSTVITANATDFIDELKRVKGVIVQTTADGATIIVNADTQQAADDFFRFNRDQLGKLDGREVVVRVKGDDGEWVTVRDDVNNQQLDDKTVRIVAQTQDAIGDIPIVGNVSGGTNAPDITVAQPEPIVYTAEDKATPVIDALKKSIKLFDGDVSKSIDSTQAAIGDGIAGGFDAGAEAAQNGAIAVVNALNIGNITFNYGFNDGYNFGVGMANGITATANAVFNAAFNVGYMAHLGTQAGMDARSPSRLAMKDGENWVAGFVQSLKAGIHPVRDAAADLSRAMQTTLSQPADSPALRGLLTVDHSARLADLRETASRGSSQQSTSVHNSIGSVAITVSGAGDAEAVADRVVTQLYRSFDRGAAAGLFGA